MNRSWPPFVFGIALLAAALMIPLVLPDFWTLHIVTRSLALGVVALSLAFLIGTCGFVSLCQMTVAGAAGYTMALLGVNASGLGVVLPWPVAVAAALFVAAAFGALVGWISHVSSDVYLLMLTLAVAVCTLYFVQQNMAVFNGFDGISGIALPEFLGTTIGADRTRQLFWLTLGVAVALYAFVALLPRTPFGLALQAMRDNPRRVSALGYPIRRYRVAAFAVAGVIAGCGGVLSTWYNAQVSPGTIDVSANVAILVMCVLGGQKKPLGAFIGALVYVVLEVFSAEVISRERFNLVIGVTFLIILYLSPDGLLGLWQGLRDAVRRASRPPRAGRMGRRVNRVGAPP